MVASIFLKFKCFSSVKVITHLRNHSVDSVCHNKFGFTEFTRASVLLSFRLAFPYSLWLFVSFELRSPMPGYYPINHREPVPMAQVYPPARSYSLAKLNMARDYGIYEKVKVDNQRRPHRMFEKLRRQQSYDDNMYPRMMYSAQQRRQDGFDSLQLLGANNDDRYLDRFMDNSRGRTLNREQEKNSKNNTLLSTKSKVSSNSSNSKNKKNENKENKRNLNLSSVAMALIGSLANSSSVDNIYESVEQIHYRKTVESMNRREKVRDVHRTGHPLFDHLREERALASGGPTTNTMNRRVSRSAGPSRKTSTVSSPLYSSNSSGDEQDNIRRNRSSNDLQQRPPRKISQISAPVWRRAGSAGSESDDEWVIPRPKIGGRKREARVPSTDESDSSSKSSPMRWSLQVAKKKGPFFDKGN